MTQTIKPQVWDTPGQRRFATFTNSYSRSVHGSTIVYDMAGKESFNNVKNQVDEIDKHTATVHEASRLCD